MYHRERIARQLAAIRDALERCQDDALVVHACHPDRLHRIDRLGETAVSAFESAERAILAFLDAASVPPQSATTAVILRFPDRRSS
jgi:hypothetical protein